MVFVSIWKRGQPWISTARVAFSSSSFASGTDFLTLTTSLSKKVQCFDKFQVITPCSLCHGMSNTYYIHLLILFKSFLGNTVYFNRECFVAMNAEVSFVLSILSS
jgi:hypothetical protein